MFLSFDPILDLNGYSASSGMKKFTILVEYSDANVPQVFSILFDCWCYST